VEEKMDKLAQGLVTLRAEEDVGVLLEGVIRDEKSLMLLLSSLGRRNSAEVCLRVVEWAKGSPGIKLNLFHYTKLINVMSRCKKWETSLKLYEELKGVGLQVRSALFEHELDATHTLRNAMYTRCTTHTSHTLYATYYSAT
jgi:pentatricopeptide repeat protein